MWNQEPSTALSGWLLAAGAVAFLGTLITLTFSPKSRGSLAVVLVSAGVGTVALVASAIFSIATMAQSENVPVANEELLAQAMHDKYGVELSYTENPQAITTGISYPVGVHTQDGFKDCLVYAGETPAASVIACAGSELVPLPE